MDIGILALLAFVGMIVGVVVWYKNKKKQIHAAQGVWAHTVSRLGGRELDQRGPGDTRTFGVGGGVLSVVNYVFVDANIKNDVTPWAAPNSWQSQHTTPCQRPTPAFCLEGIKEKGPGTGDAEFDGKWSVRPMLGASRDEVLALLTPEVRNHLNQLPPNQYQIACGGTQVCGFRGNMVASAEEVTALVSACALLAGFGAPALGAPVEGAGNMPAPTKEAWAWRFSPIFGLMYGPIPVGALLLLVIGGIYVSLR